MIKITLPTEVPKNLRVKGAALTVENCLLYTRDSASYDSGTAKFKIKSKTYGNAKVKKGLQKAHHSKCCYCESIFVATSYGAVEHYRPKLSFYQDKAKINSYPGYYWLAYDWQNLLYICTACNTIKNAYFPLKNPANRARNHTQSIVAEQPLIINPVVTDPSAHINFHAEHIVGITDEGKTTIDHLLLNRAALFEARLKAKKHFSRLILITRIYHAEHDPKYQEQLMEIKEAISEKGEYSAMLSAIFLPYANLPEFQFT